MFCVGGKLNTTNSYTNVVERYNISTDTWETFTNPPFFPGPFQYINEEAQAVVVGDYLYTSGVYDSGLSGFLELYKYDITEGIGWNWELVPPQMIIPLIYSYAVAVHGEKIYFIGGKIAGTGVVVKTLYSYDIDSGAAVELAEMPEERIRGFAEVIGNKIYYFGGSSGGKFSERDIYVYDIFDTTWATIPAVFPADLLQGTSFVIDEQIYVANKQLLYKLNLSTGTLEDTGVPSTFYIKWGGSVGVVDNKAYVYGTDYSEEEGKQLCVFSYTSGNDLVIPDIAPTDTPSLGPLILPLIFPFNRIPGLAVPLIALQYHEVNIDVTFSKLQGMKYTNDKGTYVVSLPQIGPLNNANGLGPVEFWANYIYLDTDERRKFAQNQHEYLIEQLQTQQNNINKNVENRIPLNFNHPVKELVWCSPINNGVLTPILNSDGLTSSTAYGQFTSKQQVNVFTGSGIYQNSFTSFAAGASTTHILSHSQPQNLYVPQINTFGNSNMKNGSIYDASPTMGLADLVLTLPNEPMNGFMSVS